MSTVSTEPKTEAPSPDHLGGQALSPRSRPLLVVDDPRFNLHAPRAYHPERPERLRAARDALDKSGALITKVVPRAATDTEIERVHDARYVDALSRLRGHEGHLDPDTYVGKESVDVARLAAGGLIALVDALIDGEATGAHPGPSSQSGPAQAPRGLALLRPPGHHARPSRAMGFCLLNNVAIAAAHARARGIGRVLVVDWDVHHGNGTQEMFYADPTVLYVSTHQHPFYPGTGDVEEIGEGEGRGYTVNVPLFAGGHDAVYRAAFERIILPIAEAYAPELVLVSAGFDAAARDPLAQMELSNDAFGWMARALAQVADRSARARIALVLEGGYDLVALEGGLGAALSGVMMTGTPPALASAPDALDVGRAARAAAGTWKVVK